MTAISPRNGSRPRASRLLSRLAAVLVVGSVALNGVIGSALPASAADDPEPETAGVELMVSTEASIDPGGPLVSTVTIANDSDDALSAGSLSLEVDSTPLPDGAALDAWLDEQTAPGDFHTVATAPSPELDQGTTGTVDMIADAVSLGSLKPGVYPVRARLTGASTDDADTTVWNLSATTVLVVSAPGSPVVGVLIPITATPAAGALLTVEELTALTAADGNLTGQLDAITGTSAILAVDPAIPASIRILGSRAPQSAVDWLERLERLPNDVVTLQFGDADAATQAQADQAGLLGPLDLTPLLQPDDFAQSTPAPTSHPTATPTPTPALPDNAALSAVSGAQTHVLWPRADVTEQDLDAFDTYLEGAATTILPSTSLSKEATAHSTVRGHDVLVTDAAASARLSAAAELTDAPAIARELAGAAGHLFFAEQKSSTILVGLDRSETRSPVAVRDLLSLFATPPLRLSALETAPAASAALTTTADTTRGTALKSMLGDEKRMQAFSSILDVPAVLLAPERIRMLRTIGVALTDEEFAESAAARATSVQNTLRSVSIQQPKPVQLIASAAPLPVWVRNDLPWTVHVTLHSDPSDPRLDIAPTTPVEVIGASVARVDVPIEARVASGEVRVDFRLTSATDVAIGQPTSADVTLRADWEGIGIGILGAAIALLFVFGLIRTVRRRRRDARESDADAGADAPMKENE
ncbi:MAG: DUF6049 family protein [Microbacterium sp.]